MIIKVIAGGIGQDVDSQSLETSGFSLSRITEVQMTAKQALDPSDLGLVN